MKSANLEKYKKNCDYEISNDTTIIAAYRRNDDMIF